MEGFDIKTLHFYVLLKVKRGLFSHLSSKGECRSLSPLVWSLFRSSIPKFELKTSRSLSTDTPHDTFPETDHSDRLSASKRWRRYTKVEHVLYVGGNIETKQLIPRRLLESERYYTKKKTVGKGGLYCRRAVLYSTSISTSCPWICCKLSFIFSHLTPLFAGPSKKGKGLNGVLPQEGPMEANINNVGPNR